MKPKSQRPPLPKQVIVHPPLKSDAPLTTASDADFLRFLETDPDDSEPPPAKS